jgi:lysophospholipase L1-like esterase
VVLVCLGSNDMLRGMSAEEQFANLRQIVKAIQARGALVILIGTEGYRVYTQTDYGARYQSLARETGAVYSPDILRGIHDDPSLMRDRIHPNAAGNEKIARRLLAEVGDYLRR